MTAEGCMAGFMDEWIGGGGECVNRSPIGDANTDHQLEMHNQITDWRCVDRLPIGDAKPSPKLGYPPRNLGTTPRNSGTSPRALGNPPRNLARKRAQITIDILYIYIYMMYI